ncbi:MAG: tyrosine-type recombinase/integrase [Lachnospiraceae bacterium]|nr:tyrosine-type recombinase/integrase [Lachnospiraceae bacterium]
MAKTEIAAFSPYLSPKFITILKKYYSEKIREERTKQQYTYVFNALCDYAKCDFLDITQETIKAYFNGKSSVMKSTDYNLSVLRAVARYMDENADILEIQEGYLNLFSVIDVIFPDMQFRMEDLPKLDSIDKVLAYFKSEGDMTGFLSCSMVLRSTLTTNELVSLKRDMLLQDADGNFGIRLKMTEHAYRFVKLPEDIVELIDRYSMQRTDSLPYFFLNKKGKAVSARALQNRLHEACTACGVKPFTYNDLRILSQALMIKDGAPLERIAEHINVKNMSWFFRYDRVVESLKESPVDYTHLKVVW